MGGRADIVHEPNDSGTGKFIPEGILAGAPAESAAGPDVFMLPDHDGKLRKVLGFRYRDFLDIWRAAQEGKTSLLPPFYAMQSVNLKGQVIRHQSEGPCVRLRITMQLQVEGRQPFSVPLQIGTLIIERFSLQGGEFHREDDRAGQNRHEFLMFDSEHNRYVAWLQGRRGKQDRQNERGQRGEPSEQHGSNVEMDPIEGRLPVEGGQHDDRRTILIEGLVPLEASGGEYHFQLALPGALKSQLKLHVPGSQATGQVPHSQLLTTNSSPSGGTDFLVTGMVGECNLRWQLPSQIAKGSHAIALVEDEIAVKVDLQGVRYDALLHRNNLQIANRPGAGTRAETDRFLVRLPPGCQLVNGAASPDYELVPSMDTTNHGTINSTLSSLFNSALASNSKGALASKGALSPERELVEVRFRPGRKRPATVHLVAERPFDGDHSVRSVDVSGFEMVGAIRQSGFVSLELDEQLQGYFDLEGSIHQIDIKDLPERIRQQTPIAAFSHARSRWQLHLHTVVQEPQIRVRPNYEVELTEGNSQLQVQLDYQYTGARPYLLRIDMRGWKLTDDPIESGGAVDRNRSFETNQGLLILRLVKSDSRQIKIRFVARRPAEQDASRWPLPVPLGAFVLPGNFSVRSQPSLLVTPQNGKLIGLVARSTLPPDYAFRDRSVGLGGPVNPNGSESSDGPNAFGNTMSSTEPQPTLLSFRLFKPRAEFRAEITRRDRKVAVVVEAQARIDQAVAVVNQKLRYQVNFQPATRLALMIPRALQDELPTFTLHGKPLKVVSDTGPSKVTSVLGSPKVTAVAGSPKVTSVTGSPKVTSVTGEEPPESTNGPLQSKKFVLELPHAMEGNFEVETTYHLPSGPWQAENTVPLQIPLVEPAETVTSCRVRVSASAGLRVAIQPSQGNSPSHWSPIEISDSQSTQIGEAPPLTSISSEGAKTVLMLSSSEAPLMLPLVVQIDPVEQRATTILERVWLQTWLLGSIRQERAVFCFRTKQTNISMILPFRGSHPPLEVLLDQQPIATVWTANEKLSIPIGSGKRQASHTLEIRYQVPWTADPWLRLRITPVQMDCPLSGAPVFWQLVLPKYYFVASNPAQLACEYWLGWKNAHWGRQPTMFQADLERWSSATSLQVPPPSFNQYLYSSFEMPQTIQVKMITQAWLVFISSATVFCAGILLLTTALGRNAIFLFTLFLAALILTIVRPETAVLVVVGILAGGGLTLFFILLQRMLLDTREPTALPVGNGSALGRETRSTEPWLDQDQLSSAEERALTTSLHISESAP